MKKLIPLTLMLIIIAQIAFSQPLDTLNARYKGKPIIEMTLNGKSTWVLLDTGSDITILNSEAKDQFGFNSYVGHYQSLSVSGFGSSHNQLFEVRNAKLYFGKVQLKSSFYAYDFTNIARSIHAKTGKTISAIIGTNMMESYGFVIDLGKNRVSMTYKMKKKHLKPITSEAEYTIAKNK